MARIPQNSFHKYLEKKQGFQNQIWKLLVEEKQIADHKEISNNIKIFYETLLKRNDLCENKIRENDIFDSMKSMKNNKSPGNEGLTKKVL